MLHNTPFRVKKSSPFNRKASSSSKSPSQMKSVPHVSLYYRNAEYAELRRGLEEKHRKEIQAIEEKYTYRLKTRNCHYTQDIFRVRKSQKRVVCRGHQILNEEHKKLVDTTAKLERLQRLYEALQKERAANCLNRDKWEARAKKYWAKLSHCRDHVLQTLQAQGCQASWKLSTVFREPPTLEIILPAPTAANAHVPTTNQQVTAANSQTIGKPQSTADEMEIESTTTKIISPTIASAMPQLLLRASSGIASSGGPRSAAISAGGPSAFVGSGPAFIPSSFMQPSSQPQAPAATSAQARLSSEVELDPQEQQQPSPKALTSEKKASPQLPSNPSQNAATSAKPDAGPQSSALQDFARQMSANSAAGDWMGGPSKQAAPQKTATNLAPLMPKSGLQNGHNSEALPEAATSTSPPQTPSRISPTAPSRSTPTETSSGSASSASDSSGQESPVSPPSSVDGFVKEITLTIAQSKKPGSFGVKKPTTPAKPGRSPRSAASVPGSSNSAGSKTSTVTSPKSKSASSDHSASITAGSSGKSKGKQKEQNAAPSEILAGHGSSSLGQSQEGPSQSLSKGGDETNEDLPDIGGAKRAAGNDFLLRQKTSATEIARSPGGSVASTGGAAAGSSSSNATMANRKPSKPKPKVRVVNPLMGQDGTNASQTILRWLNEDLVPEVDRWLDNFGQDANKLATILLICKQMNDWFKNKEKLGKVNDIAQVLRETSICVLASKLLLFSMTEEKMVQAPLVQWANTVAVYTQGIVNRRTWEGRDGFKYQSLYTQEETAVPGQPDLDQEKKAVSVVAACKEITKWVSGSLLPTLEFWKKLGCGARVNTLECQAMAATFSDINEWIEAEALDINGNENPVNAGLEDRLYQSTPGLVDFGVGLAQYIDLHRPDDGYADDHPLVLLETDAEILRDWRAQNP